MRIEKSDIDKLLPGALFGGILFGDKDNLLYEYPEAGFCRIFINSFSKPHSFNRGLCVKEGEITASFFRKTTSPKALRDYKLSKITRNKVETLSYIDTWVNKQINKKESTK